MQDWVSATESFATWLGIDQDALRILAALLLSIATALLIRRPLSSPVPWIVVLVLATGHEVATAWADRIVTRPEWMHGLRDVLLAMTVPTALMLLGRYAPSTLSSRQDRRILVPAVWEKPARVVETDFKEVA